MPHANLGLFTPTISVITTWANDHDGLTNYQIILNRKKAIQTALRKNNKDKIVLIFGKGHENYQIFSAKKSAFNDNNEVKKVLHLKK